MNSQRYGRSNGLDCGEPTGRRESMVYFAGPSHFAFHGLPADSDSQEGVAGVF